MFKNLESKNIVRNSGYLITSAIISKLLFMVLTILIGRALGVESLGIYGFVFAFTSIIFSFSGIGNYVFVRDVITNKKFFSKFWGNFLILNFLTSVIVYAVTVIITHILPIPERIKLLVYLTGLILFFSIFSETARSVLIAYQKIKPLALVNVFENLLIVGLSILFVWLGKGISWIQLFELNLFGVGCQWCFSQKL